MSAAGSVPALGTCTLRCPYCGEALAMTVDASAGAQRYIEDCAVCCRPIEVAVEVEADGARLVARREDEG